MTPQPAQDYPGSLAPTCGNQPSSRCDCTPAVQADDPVIDCNRCCVDFARATVMSLTPASAAIARLLSAAAGGDRLVCTLHMEAAIAALLARIRLLEGARVERFEDIA